MLDNTEQYVGKIVVGRTIGNSLEARLVWKTPYEVFKNFKGIADEISDLLIERGTRLPLSTYNDAETLMLKIGEIARCVKPEGDEDAHWWIKEYRDWREVDWAQTQVKVCEHEHTESWEVVANELLNLIKKAKFNPVFATITDIQNLNRFCVRVWELAYLNDPDGDDD